MTLSTEVISKFMLTNKTKNIKFLNNLNERMINIIKKDLLKDSGKDLNIILSNNELKKILQSPEFENKIRDSFKSAIEDVDKTDTSEITLALTRKLVPVYTNMYFYGLYKIVKKNKNLLSDDIVKKITSKEFFNLTKNKIKTHVTELTKKLDPDIAKKLQEHVTEFYSKSNVNLNEDTSSKMKFKLQLYMAALISNFIIHCVLVACFYALLKVIIGDHNKKYNISYSGLFLLKPSEYKKLLNILTDQDISLIRKVFVSMLMSLFVFLIFKLIKDNIEFFKNNVQITDNGLVITI